MPDASYLIALDWGTSSLRAALMNAQGSVLREISTDDGIMSIADGGFHDVFDRLIGPWLRDYPASLVLAAGMIGSRQGWCEAPYVPCPAGFDELGAGLVWSGGAGVPVGFVPGLATHHANGAPDVIRGEEVQIFGALDASGLKDGIFVLPGTHSKWAVVENRRILQFHTFMTGELFALLRQHSILSRLMPSQDAIPWEQGRDSFVAGCSQAVDDALLHRLFSVRAQGLFGMLAGDQQSDYLSGLVIGEEIREALSLVPGAAGGHIHLVCKPSLFKRYQAALSVFGVDSSECTQQASFQGMLAIARGCGLIS
ncbi:2-dehydro-3-deoxygalactonokinase [Paralcaligenes sp. KSB-10]|uniref:2-dehydro-3-deoxygalactonokinase n=1 Tax=Paralcaligenes sp. KSB-10 TaxID=2901142 RepID=UPI001E294946|nr:2-dehydro-3-deoxygalactonokinase [Paralcaligenes sp. KSB-10]UHL64978.1 2-dehydro-3-deoxygalactonokinase [Paralcaligenes sp. KSB-10]